LICKTFEFQIPIGNGCNFIEKEIDPFSINGYPQEVIQSASKLPPRCEEIHREIEDISRRHALSQELLHRLFEVCGLPYLARPSQDIDVPWSHL